MTQDNDIDLIVQSLEVCAERSGDVVPAVYQAFFAADQAAQDLMDHSDEHMQGRMLESVWDLLMSDEHFGPNGYLEWELTNHLDAYSVTPEMYESLFQSLMDVVEVSLGNDWTESYSAAWNHRVDLIMGHVHGHKTTWESVEE